MKAIILTAAILSASLMAAQTSEKKQATVRIKKVENINGVETVTDTTFKTDDVSALQLGNDMNVQTIDIIGDDHGGKMEKVVIVDNGSGKEEQFTMKEIPDMKNIDAEIEKAMKEAGVDPKTSGMKKTVIVNEDAVPGKDGKSVSKVTKIVILKLDITDASEEDVKRLNTQLGNADNKLEMENMKLYPNPNNGKFNLNFNLKSKADAEVTVYDMQGKQVYNEKLPNFTGEYNKPIDISENSKGVYFVKIQQGDHTQVKKIVLD